MYVEVAVSDAWTYWENGWQDKHLLAALWVWRDHVCACARKFHSNNKFKQQIGWTSLSLYTHIYTVHTCIKYGWTVILHTAVTLSLWLKTLMNTVRGFVYVSVIKYKIITSTHSRVSLFSHILIVLMVRLWDGKHAYKCNIGFYHLTSN